MKWFYNFKIGTKLIISFLIVAIIAGGIGVLGVININRLNSNDQYMYNQMTVPLGEMVTIVESYQRMRGNVKDIILASTPDEIADYESKIDERNKEFNEALTSFQTTLFSDEGRALVEEMFTLKEDMDAQVNEIIQLVKNGDKATATYEVQYGQFETLRQQMEANYRKLVELKVLMAETTKTNNQSVAQSSSVITIVLLIAGMIISMLLGVFISSIIKKPINQMVDASKRMADGDLDVYVDLDTKDELGVLAKSFNRMAQNMNQVLLNINEATSQVASGSRQVSDSSVSLSQGATEQASAVEQLTSAIEQIAAQTKQNADHANEANGLAEFSKTSAIEGNRQMQEMLHSMDEISDSSHNISKIIKVIDEIAFQTNILALNAAVEAAKAGQNGKGFAVVAVEVRNLAARSADAAKETTTLIEGSIKKVDSGTKIANRTAEELRKIVESIEKVYELISQISLASNEQAIGVNQVNTGVNQISNVVQSTSATSQETAAASEELASQAEMLKEQVARFKLRVTGFERRNNDDNRSSNLEYGNFQKNEQEFSQGVKQIFLNDDEFGKY
ncbi:methyl-accepting chemotaxis protein [Eubacteriaceae bacterium ES2]|nr:methyl-accepting chemotaxis protein [Eubacteriaceae bacterium ES2]